MRDEGEYCMKSLRSVILKLKTVISNSKLLLALLINGFFLLLVLLFCDMKYEVSDDFIMSTIISGVYTGRPNPHMIFVNIVLGYMLEPFYKIFPGISWYFLFQIIIIFVSSIVVTFVVLEKADKVKGVLLSIIFLLFFVNDMYILMQFTKTAMFVVISGSWLFLDALFYEKNRRRVLIGGGLCVIGTMVRFYVIYLAGGFLIFIIGYEVVKMIRAQSDRRISRKKIGRIVIGGSILIGVSFGLNELDQCLYEKDEAYAFFREYGKARGEIVDYLDYGYEAYANELGEIGISENDYYMLKKWGFADNDFFTLERVQKTADIIKSYNRKQWSGWEAIIEKIQERKITNYPVFMANIFLLLLGLFLNYEKLWTSVVVNGIGWCYILYFFIRDRNVYRTEFAVFLGVFLCCIYFWTEDKKKNVNYVEIRKKCGVVIIALCIVKSIIYLPDRTYMNVSSEEKKNYVENIFFESWNYDARKYRKVVNKVECKSGLLDEFHNNSEKFYFLDFNTTIQTLYYEWSPWETVDNEDYQNYYYLSGITSNFPAVVNKFEAEKVSNPLRDLVKEYVYVVDNYYVDIKLNYLKEHYFPNARAELYKEVDGYQIWKFYKE